MAQMRTYADQAQIDPMAQMQAMLAQYGAPQLANSPLMPQQAAAPPANYGALQAQIANAQRQQKLAEALMQAGYVSNSGGLGALAQIVSAWKGGKLERKAGETVADATARGFTEQERLKEVERQQKLGDERVAADEALRRAQQLKQTEGWEAGTPLATNQGIVNVRGNTYTPIRPAGAQQPQVGTDGLTGANDPTRSDALAASIGNALVAKGVDPAIIETVISNLPGMHPETGPEQATDGNGNVIANDPGVLMPPDKVSAPSDFDTRLQFMRDNPDRFSQADIDAFVQGTTEKPMSEYQRTQTRMKSLKAKSAVTSATKQLQELASAAQLVLDGGNIPGITGAQSYFPNWRGSAASNTQARLDALKTNVGFTALQEMRAASPTGGALGNVSDSEGSRLERSKGNLENAQSAEEMERVLRDIISDANTATQRLQTGFDEDFGQFLNDEQPKEKAAAAPAIPDGTPHPDGIHVRSGGQWIPKK